MVPIVSIVGKPDSGKSTIIEKLLPVLKARGYSVGVIKHTYHEVPLDTPGKDTDRFATAGSSTTALVSKQGMALFMPDAASMSLESIADEYFTSMDIVIAEGYKGEEQPKIEVCNDPDGALNDSITNRVAVISDHPLETELPVFKRSDIEPLAEFIEKSFLLKGSRSEVKLWVDGEFITIKPFVKAFIGQTIKGMLQSLRGSKNAEKIRIKIGR